MSVAETVLTETRGRVGLLTLNRPKALNALNQQMMHEAVAALQAFDCDPAIGCMVVTGSERAFAAGADIKEMQPQSYQQMYAADWFAGWDAIDRIRKPIIAAVSGFAISYWRPTRPGLGSRKSNSASFPASADHNALPAPLAKRKRWSSA
jgi:enoyl-CoA hydratase